MRALQLCLQEHRTSPAVLAREREEETWAQLAAKVPPRKSTSYGGTMGMSRSVGLMWKDELQHTISATQTAALVMEQRAPHPTPHPKSGD